MRRSVLTAMVLMASPVLAAGPWPSSLLPAETIQWDSVAAPKAGDVSSVSAGSTMFERTRTGRVALTQLDTNASWGGLAGPLLYASSKLAVFEDADGVHACGTDYNKGICVLDADRDGLFETGEDRSYGRSMHKALKKPIAAKPLFFEPVYDAGGQFKQVLVYNGAAGGVLRLAYREFINDMARPAFSNEVTFQLSGKFPEEVAYKDIVIEVLGVSNAGIRFAVKKVGTAP